MSTVTTTATAETAITSWREVWPRSPIHAPAARNRPASRATSASTKTAARNASVGREAVEGVPDLVERDEAGRHDQHRTRTGDQQVGHTSPRDEREDRDPTPRDSQSSPLAPFLPDSTRALDKSRWARGPETWLRSWEAASSDACSRSPASRSGWRSASSTRSRARRRRSSATWSWARSATRPRSPKWRRAQPSSPTSGRACPPTRRASSSREACRCGRGRGHSRWRRTASPRRRPSVASASAHLPSLRSTRVPIWTPRSRQWVGCPRCSRRGAVATTARDKPISTPRTISTPRGRSSGAARSG